MTFEEFKKLQFEMTDEELVEKCTNLVSDLCRSGGSKFTMRVPLDINDSDMLLSELIRRYKNTINK
jgi:hypothetical protein